MMTHIAYQVEELSGSDDSVRVWRARSEQVRAILDQQFCCDIPVVTVNFLGEHYYGDEIGGVVGFVKSLRSWSGLSKYRTKVSIIGKWYDLPGILVEELKLLIEETAMYDETFLNIGILYNAQTEIEDVGRSIGRAVKSGKIDPDVLSSDTVREFTYASHIPPPQKLILTGGQDRVRTFLYDAPVTAIILVLKRFEELTLDDSASFLEDRANRLW